MPASVVIRPAHAEDAGALAEGLRQLDQEIGLAHHLFKSDAQSLRQAAFGELPLIHAMLGEVTPHAGLCGFAVYYPIYSTLRAAAGVQLLDLWVAPQARGTGLGRKLLTTAASDSHEKWNARYLQLTVYHNNDQAIGFYHALGLKMAEDEHTMWLEAPAFERSFQQGPPGTGLPR